MRLRPSRRPVADGRFGAIALVVTQLNPPTLPSGAGPAAPCPPATATHGERRTSRADSIEPALSVEYA